MVLIVPASAARAQDSGLSDRFRTGSEVIVGQDETISDDLYASGGRVQIAGAVNGDAIAAGGEVGVDGTVNQDVLVAGGQVRIAGEVAGDVRAAGGRVTLEGLIAEDVLVTGGQIVIARGAEIGGDLIFSGGEMTLDGTVDGDVIGNADDYRRDGSVGGREEVEAGREEVRTPTVGDRVLGGIRRYVAVLVIGALLLWLVPRLLEGAAAETRARPLPSLGVGALGAVGWILAIVVIILAAVLLSLALGLAGLGSLVATAVVGAVLAIAVLSFSFTLVVAFVADALVGLVSGRLLLRSDDGGSWPARFAALALGAALIVLFTALPAIGGVIKLLVVLLGLGSLLLAIRRRRSRGVATAT
jgi:cytoskeletal protein CcmA (bactofilin family)